MKHVSEIGKQQWDALLRLMDAAIAEAILADLAPCTRAEFWQEYKIRDPEFAAPGQ